MAYQAIKMSKLTEWLASLGYEAKAKRLTIKGVEFECAVYLQDGREMLYAIGDLPACVKRRGHTVFNFDGDSRDWYICCYATESCLREPFSAYHPFGLSFQMAPWAVPSGEPIDKYNYWQGEHKPYTRVTATLTTMTKAYLYRRGNGNEGNFIRAIVDLKASESPYAALRALVVNDYIARNRVRRHIIKTIEIDGEADYVILATVYEGPDGETDFAYITAELRPLDDADLSYYVDSSLHRTTLACLDTGARKVFRAHNIANV